ncbi:MAG: glutamate--tRNA ligase [Polyangiaceae bacterium]|nr:glutamate--tRNA ligase [Polyangiaceae bacterium]
MPPRVRFAPSPSGYLHIGGARTALFNWLWARRQGGTFILRVEDTDQERSRPESIQGIVDSMRWLGLDWDEGPGVGGPCAPYFQSERRALYREAAERLVREGKAYRCYCTKEELDVARAKARAEHPNAQFVYPGTCRDRKDEPDRPHAVRFKASREGAVAFVDKVFGTITTPNKELQDFVLLRSDGYPLYNLAAVVDDHEMGITLVARGRDHLGNTPQQILIYRALGYEPPEFAHLPMILSPSGEKLSKRHAAVGVDEYRARGYTPVGVLNYLVRFGWSFGDQEIFSRRELVDLFDWQRVSRSDGRFDEKKFLDVNFEHMKRDDLTPPEAYADMVVPLLRERGLAEPDRATLLAALPLVRERARTLVEAAHHLDFYFRDPPEFDDKAKAKFLTPQAAPWLDAVHRLFEQGDFTASRLEQAVKSWLDQEQLSMKQVAQPLRVCVTGRSASPPLFDVLEVLGRPLALRRLERGAELARKG